MSKFKKVFSRVRTAERRRWRRPDPFSNEEETRLVAQQYRRERKKPLGALKGEQRKSVLGWNNHIDKIARSIIRKRKKSGPVTDFEQNLKRRVLTWTIGRSILLSGLLPGRDQIWQPISSRLRSRKSTNIEVKDFSFLTNANGAISALKKIAQAEAECLTGRINFLDEECMDLGPWLVLAVMRPEMAPVFTGGAIGDGVSAVIKALRLHEPLRFTLGETSRDGRDIWAFPLRSRRRAGTSKSPTQFLDPQNIEKVGDELCEALDSWLSASANCMLSVDGRRLVRKIIGETLDNAERYSRPELPNDGDWSISGFMRRSQVGGVPRFECQLAFLSVGASISSTVQGCDAHTKAEMDQYIAMHRGAIANHAFADDHLRTIYALQDMVSGDAQAIASGRGGTGFRDIITFFGDLVSPDTAEESARLAILSGRTCLHIDWKYCSASRPKSQAELFNIWFNEENRRDMPPNPASVVELADPLNGTLVTMAFQLDRDYLRHVSHAQS